VVRTWPDTGGENDCGLQQPSDISKIVDWLAIQPGIDPNRIGIVGISQGGQVGLLAAAMNPKVRAVIAYAPHDPSAPEWDELATLESVWSWLDENL